MATETLTYTSDFWKLWTYQTQAGSFVLDFSQLNGADVLGNGTDGLAVTDYPIASVSIHQGSTLDYGVVHTIAPASAEVTLNVKDFTADQINDFYVGTAVAITVDNHNGTAEPWAWMFSGVIDSASVTFMPGEDYATISISATGSSANTLNAGLNVTKNETTSKSALIQAAATAAGIAIGFDTSAYNFKGTARESKTIGEWAADLALCDFMQMRDTPQPLYVYQPFPTSTTWYVSYYTAPYFAITKYTGTSAGTLDETDITDVQLDWSGAGSPTGVTLTNYTDQAIIYQYGSTETAAGGAVTYSNTVDLKDITQMTAVGQQLLAMVKAFKPITVNTITATNYQSVVYKSTNLPSDYGTVDIIWKPQNLYEVGETITIDLPDYGIDNNNMIIVGRTITVTPDNWTTSYDLWKGFTS